MIIGALEGAGGVDHEKRTIDRALERVAGAHIAPVKLRPDPVREIGILALASPRDGARASRIACHGLGDPSTEDAVTAQDRNDARRIGHSGSTQPSYWTIWPRKGA